MPKPWSFLGLTPAQRLSMLALGAMGASHFSDLTELVGANPPWLPWLWAEEGRHGGTTPTKLLLKWDAPGAMDHTPIP